MTPQDVTDLLTYFGQAYPAAKAEPGTELIWLQHLHETPTDTARQAALRWVGREKWMPTVAEMRAECKAVERAHLQVVTAELPAAPAPRTEVQSLVAEMRARLVVGNARQHDHRGPAPCPVCGGVAGKLGDQRAVTP